MDENLENLLSRIALARIFNLLKKKLAKKDLIFELTQQEELVIELEASNATWDVGFEDGKLLLGRDDGGIGNSLSKARSDHLRDDAHLVDAVLLNVDELH